MEIIRFPNRLVYLVVLFRMESIENSSQSPTIGLSISNRKHASRRRILRILLSDGTISIFLLLLINNIEIHHEINTNINKKLSKLIKLRVLRWRSD